MNPTAYLHTAYLSLIAVLALVATLGVAYWHHSTFVAGETRCISLTREAAAQQAIQDSKVAQETVDALNLEISRLRSATAPSATGPPARVQCYARPVPAAPSQPGTAPAIEPASPGEVLQPVPGGIGVGGDLGPSLQRLALAADLVSARDRACLKELKEP